ncbi:MAG: TolC family protein [Candidatus Wallbacteria bacterium]|nr:TolC family protein [Candidatus Wallbacteria bacterium]
MTQALLDIRSLAGARAAGELTRAARGDADQARVNLVADVKTAFYDLLFSGEAHRVASETVAQVERQLAQANSLVAAGTAPHLDEIRAEVQLANVKSALIRAEYQTEIARETLAHLMAVKASTPVEAQGEFLGVEPVATREVLLKQAAGGRPDLRAARRRLAAARSGLRSARAGRLPTVNFTAAYDKSQGQRFPLGEELDIKSATVNVNLPIFDGQLTDGRVQEAEAQRLKAQHDLEALEQQIELDVTRATALVAQSEAVISATQKAVQQAREALDIANEAYRVGTRTYLELLDAQLALSVADINRSQAQRDYSVARAALDRALGLPDPRQPQLASSRTTKETTK